MANVSLVSYAGYAPISGLTDLPLDTDWSSIISYENADGTTSFRFQKNTSLFAGDNFVVTLTGSDLSIDANTQELSGTVTSLSYSAPYTQSTVPQYEITDISIDAQVLFAAGNSALELVLSDSDIINGTEDINTIFGYGGNDTISGFGGNDIIYGGAGNDLIYGGVGGDKIYGGSGNDALYGDAGNDIIYGSVGNDYINGGQGQDKLFGGVGNDHIIGGTGNDSIRAGDGKDILFGNSGNDYLFGDAGNDKLYGGSGADYLFGGSGADRIFGSTGDDVIFGGDGDDYINGGTGADYIDGGAGTDRIVTGADYDVIKFGNGSGGDFVLDFEDGKDRIDLSFIAGVNASSNWQDFVGYGATLDGTGTVIWNGADFIILNGFDVSNLDSSDFYVG